MLIKTVCTITLASSAAFASNPTTSMSGDSARSLFSALIQADLKNSVVTELADPKDPNAGLSIVDQKVSLRKLNCKTAYTGVGTETGFCTVRDQSGSRVRLGSAASVAIMHALPDGFGDAALGHFTAEAEEINCEIDARRWDSTGTAIAECSVR